MEKFRLSANGQSVQMPLRGPLLTAGTSVVLAVACLMDWADVQIIFLSKTYAGTHFGEGQLTLALALGGAAIAVASALWESRLVYLLPLVAMSALVVTTMKYDDVQHAFSSVDGFRIAHASAGNGLLLAVCASVALLAASLFAVRDRLRLEPHVAAPAAEVD